MSTKVKQFFNDYKKSDEVHETSDGFLFHQDHEANTHAKTLDDKKVKKHVRGSQTDEDAEKLAAEKAAKEAEKKAAAEKAKADKEAAAKLAAEEKAKKAAEKKAADDKGKVAGSDPK